MATARDKENPANLDLKAWGNHGMNQLTPLWLLKYLPNMLACHVTIIHELKGPSNTITCADASSHLAIGEAFRTYGIVVGAVPFSVRLRVQGRRSISPARAAAAGQRLARRGTR